MTFQQTEKIKTLGQLKASGFVSKSIKQEMRDNLITALKDRSKIFHGIKGFDETVIPDLERAILSRHNILLLGLRGQAKTRIARLMVDFLDDFIPIVAGSEINDDPLQPMSKYARDLVASQGDDTPISWLAKADRYVEKLATPDVSIADLIGDVDPIKAATQKLSYADEGVIHFGLMPRAHRSLFVINELPDLQPRIQVALFNILQEGDMQIRGFKLRLPLDIQFVFTANPEDYTNRGSIITPLKDRIESQILTHYPEDIEIAKEITLQEAKLSETQTNNIDLPDQARTLLELITIHARDHEFTDEKSGVSMRLSISALENLMSTAERRMIINQESNSRIRLSDFWGIIPSITGKVELVYEGEQAGAHEVALDFLGKAVRSQFLQYFPDPRRSEKSPSGDPYGTIREYFAAGNDCLIPMDASESSYREVLQSVAGLQRLVDSAKSGAHDMYYLMELVLHGLAEYDILRKDIAANGLSFRDDLADMLTDLDDE